ncbi:MAG: AMP-binding protein [Proteobacteria bacterium]|nr:AMP-binding protein [Pseudomonadota bacterium]
MSADTLASRLATAAQTRGRIVFLDAQEQELAISHAELFARAQRAAGGIAAQGIEPGERVAIIAATSPAFFDGFFGAILAGAVPVPLYPPVRLGRMQEYHERTAAMLRAARADRAGGLAHAPRARPQHRPRATGAGMCRARGDPGAAARAARARSR